MKSTLRPQQKLFSFPLKNYSFLKYLGTVKYTYI